MKELAVIARTSPSLSSEITVTPVTNRPTVWRRSARRSVWTPPLNSQQQRPDSQLSLWVHAYWELGIGIRELPRCYVFGVVIFFMITLTSSGLIRSGTVQPLRSYSAMHCSAKPL